MADNDAAVADPATPWILEWQRTGLTGAWETTAPLFSGVSWLLDMAGMESEEPPPFQAFADRDARRPMGGGGGGGGSAAAEALRALVYRLPGERLTHSLWVDDTTDGEGWTYASAAGRFDVDRLGGRAGRRFGDRYRRRWWCARDGGGSPARRLAAAAPPYVEDHERVRRSLFDAMAEVFGRRTLDRLPLDPTAAMRRSAKDAEAYEDFCRRLPAWEEANVLGSFCVASLYSRAAYGHVARMGLFDSIFAGAKVFSVQKVAFDLAEDVDPASHTQAFLDMMALPREALICADWKPRGPFHSSYVVARDDAMRWVVVAVRGTLSTTDILTDMAAGGVSFLGGRSHEGFVTSTMRLLQAVSSVLQEELAAQPGYRLVFCGHSAGGAVAAMATAWLRQETPWGRGCVSFGFGTPAVLARRTCEQLAEERAVYTAVNGYDWSPRASISAINEIMDDLCELSLLRTALRLATGGGAPRPPAVESPGAEQLPPGRLLQIVAEDPTGDEGPGRGGPRLRLLSARPVDYRHTMPMFPDAEAHLPIHYVRGLLLGFAEAARAAPPPASTRDPADARGGSSDPEGGLAGRGGSLPASPEEEEEEGPRLAASTLCRIALRPGDEANLPRGLPSWPDRGRELVTEVLPMLQALLPVDDSEPRERLQVQMRCPSQVTRMHRDRQGQVH